MVAYTQRLRNAMCSRPAWAREMLKQQNRISEVCYTTAICFPSFSTPGELRQMSERITAKNQSPCRLLHCLLPKLTSPHVLKFRSHTLTPALESPTHLLNYSTHGRRMVPLQLREKQKPAKRTTQSHLAQDWTETSREQMGTRAVRGKSGDQEKTDCSGM